MDRNLIYPAAKLAAALYETENNIADKESLIDRLSDILIENMKFNPRYSCLKYINFKYYSNGLLTYYDMSVAQIKSYDLNNYIDTQSKSKIKKREKDISRYLGYQANSYIHDTFGIKFDFIKMHKRHRDLSLYEKYIKAREYCTTVLELIETRSLDLIKLNNIKIENNLVNVSKYLAIQVDYPLFENLYYMNRAIHIIKDSILQKIYDVTLPLLEENTVYNSTNMIRQSMYKSIELANINFYTNTCNNFNCSIEEYLEFNKKFYSDKLELIKENLKNLDSLIKLVHDDPDYISSKKCLHHYNIITFKEFKK